VKDLFENQLRLEGIEHKDDNKGSRFYGLRFRTYSDVAEPLLITKHPPPVTDVTCTVTDETRTSDGCDVCDGFLLSLYGHLPTPCASGAPPRGVGVPIESLCNNSSVTSHPSLVRTLDVTDMSHPSLVLENGVAPTPAPVAEPPSEGCPVGDCPRCGADQVSLVQRHGQPACVGCSLHADDELAACALRCLRTGRLLLTSDCRSRAKRRCRQRK
jgi:hypothetical protein